MDIHSVLTHHQRQVDKGSVGFPDLDAPRCCDWPAAVLGGQRDGVRFGRGPLVGRFIRSLSGVRGRRPGGGDGFTGVCGRDDGLEGVEGVDLERLGGLY
jgi:hypothetical protein